jgi:hypothetical protein
VAEPKGGIDSPANDYQDAHFEFTLGFSVDDAKEYYCFYKSSVYG